MAFGVAAGAASGTVRTLGAAAPLNALLVIPVAIAVAALFVDAPGRRPRQQG